MLLGAVQVTLIAAITVTTVALPLIARDMRLDERGLVLVSSGYGISFGGLLPFGGRLAGRFGSRRVFTAGTVIFGVASAGAGLAPWPTLLVAARLAEGAGAALVAPAAVALLGAVFPDPERHGGALAIWGVLSAPHPGLLIFPFGVGLAFSAATVTAMHDAGAEQAGLAGALVAAAMETGPPLGLATATWAATACSPDPAAGYPFALRAASILLLSVALFTMISRSAGRPKEEQP